MKSVDQAIVFCQYLSLLPRSILDCPLANYDYDNQLFIALITVGLLEIMRFKKNSRQTVWEFYKLIREYLLDPWKKLQEELNRPKNASKGRQKARDRPIKEFEFAENLAIVSPISKEHFLKRK